MTGFQINVAVVGANASLSWPEDSVDLETLQQAIAAVVDELFIDHGLRRLEVELPDWDRPARTALHRAGFRLEGRRREALEPHPGVFHDLLIYALLAADSVHGPEGFSGMLDSLLPKKRLIAHALFRDEEGLGLLLETTYKHDWELPGGVVEPGETPRAGAEREIAEEIGLAVELDQPALVDWMPPHLGWSDAVEFIFDGGTIDRCTAAGLVPTDSEIRALHWVAMDDIANHVSELSARRISLIQAGETGYTEAGYLVSRQL